MARRELRTDSEAVPQDALPRGWRTVQLADVVLKPKQRNPGLKPDETFEYVDVSSVSRESLKIESTTRCLGKEAPSRARKAVQAGDVIFATVRPTLRRIAIVPPELDNQICSTAFCVIRANPQFGDSGFLFFATARSDFVKQVSEGQRGVNYPAITDRQVLAGDIGLPPLPEQRAIAGVLRTVQEAKEACERVIAATRQLKQSLLAHLFTYGPVPFSQADQVELQDTEYGPRPIAWKIVALKDAVSGIDYGLSAAIPKVAPENAVNIVSTADITKDGHLLYGQIRRIEAPAKTIARLSLRNGDLLFNWRNSPELIGKTAIFSSQPTAHIFASFILRIRTDEQRTHNVFLRELLNYYRACGVFLLLARRAVNQANYNRNEISVLKIPSPPVEIQREIATQLATVDARLAAEESRRHALASLFTSLLHNLMTGRVRLPEFARGS